MVCRTLSVVLLSLILILQPASASDEKFGANFLQQLTSAEVDGMGESLAAYSTGVRSLNNNPAGLVHADGSELLINAHELPRITAIIMKQNMDGEWKDYARYDVEPTDMALISYALSLNRFGKLGLGFIFHYGGRFIRVNEEGKAVNSFPRDDLAFTIGYSLKLFRGLSIGFDVENIRSKVPVDDEKNIGRTNAMNVGLMHQIGKRVRVGAVVQNLGADLSFNSPDIPNELRRRTLVGAVYILRDREKSTVSLSMDINPSFDDGARYNIGAELLYAQRVALRVGYLRDTQVYYESLFNLNDESAAFDSRDWVRKGMTIGLGLRLGNFEIDVARAPRRKPVLNDDEKLRLEEHDPIVSFSCSTKF